MNFIIDLCIYPYDIMFSVGESDNQFKRSTEAVLPDEFLPDLSEDGISHLDCNCRGRTFHHLIGGQTIIRLPKRPVTAIEIGTLSHEIFHAVDFIFRRINMPLTDSSCEAYAYCIGYLTENFYRGIKK
jgi:hypothetical protein